MPQTVLPKKNKIFLADYPYKRDIENRLFMANLSILEVKVLQEILNNSLRIPISELCDSLSCPEYLLQPIFDKFSLTGLVMRKNDSLFVDKELRKYYEFHIQKFDNDFEPDLFYLQGLLSKIPISLLPQWYTLPRTSDNIFSSLIEKYFTTPKHYEKYLNDLVFDDQCLNSIANDLFNSQDLTLTTDSIREKYSLSRERLEELILLLELHLVAVLSYKNNGSNWDGVITPFYEWKRYLAFNITHSPVPIKETDQITRTHPKDFGFLLDLQNLLKTFDTKNSQSSYISDFHTLIDQAKILGFVEETANTTKLKKSPEEFLRLAIQDQGILIYRQAISDFLSRTTCPLDYVERSFREIEKSLIKVFDKNWILYEDFIKGFTAHIGNAAPVTLKKVGSKWCYVLPSYHEKHLEFVELTIMKMLYYAGITATGTYKGKPCFSVTEFGKIALSE
jgi:hypothetical protein